LIELRYNQVNQSTLASALVVNKSAPAESQQQLSLRQSPRKAIALAASQATENCLFESQIRDLLPEEAVAAPMEGSNAATEANTDDNSADIYILFTYISRSEATFLNLSYSLIASKSN
jgi:hypothetical protein